MTVWEPISLNDANSTASAFSSIRVSKKKVPWTPWRSRILATRRFAFITSSKVRATKNFFKAECPLNQVSRESRSPCDRMYVATQ